MVGGVWLAGRCVHWASGLGPSWPIQRLGWRVGGPPHSSTIVGPEYGKNSTNPGKNATKLVIKPQHWVAYDDSQLGVVHALVPPHTGKWVTVGCTVATGCYT